jgi:hypothetical protein
MGLMDRDYYREKNSGRRGAGPDLIMRIKSNPFTLVVLIILLLFVMTVMV